MVINPGCMLASPGKHLETLSLGPTYVQLSHNMWGYGPGIIVFPSPLVNLMGIRLENHASLSPTPYFVFPFHDWFLLASQSDLSLTPSSKLMSCVTILCHVTLVEHFLALSLSEII